MINYNLNIFLNSTQLIFPPKSTYHLTVFNCYHVDAKLKKNQNNPAPAKTFPAKKDLARARIFSPLAVVV